MRKFAVVLLTGMSVILVPTFLTSCFTHYINPVHFWPATFLALGFPILMALMAGLTIAWLLVSKKVAAASLAICLVGFGNLQVSFGFTLPRKFMFDKPSGSIRIASWNVERFRTSDKKAEAPHAPRREMINFLKNINADILLLQEFDEQLNPNVYSNIKVLSDTLGYKYYYLSKPPIALNTKEETTIRSAIFSKYPLENCQRVPLPGSLYNESLIYADCIIGNKKYRVSTFHLASLQLGSPPKDKVFFGRVDGDFLLQSSRIEKLQHYYGVHAMQATFIKQVLDQSPYPLVMGGDFNSVPTSYAYHTLCHNLNDVFVLKGTGPGRTFTGLFPTLRIDYIFAGKQFNVLQYYSPRLYLSDHFPVVTDVEWN